jgi:hypothetical protein
MEHRNVKDLEKTKAGETEGILQKKKEKKEGGEDVNETETMKSGKEKRRL